MLTLRRLVDDAALKMRLLVPGADDAAGAEFLWIHNTELPDPSAYVRERELVMTNGLWLADVPAADFVSSVVRAGGAGIVFGLRLEMPATPRELVDACRTQGLPLAEIAIDVPFTTISQAAAAVLAEMRHERRAALSG